MEYLATYMMLLLNLFGALACVIFKEVTAKSICIVVACASCIFSLLVPLHPVLLRFNQLQFLADPNSTPLLIISTLSLLCFVLITPRPTKEIWPAFLLCLSIQLGFVSMNPISFAIMWIFSIVFYGILTRNTQTVFLIIMAFAYLITSAIPLTTDPTSDPILFIVRAIPLLLSCGFFPFNFWLKTSIEKDISISGLSFLLGMIPVTGLSLFVVKFLPIGTALLAHSIALALSILIILTIFLNENKAVTFSSIISLTVIALVILPPANPAIACFMVFSGGLGVMYLSFSKKDEYGIQKWLFLGLPGGAIFVAYLLAIITIIQAYPYFAVCMLISIIMLAARETSEAFDQQVYKFSRLSLAKTILVIISLIIGIYPKPWIELSAKQDLLIENNEIVGIKAVLENGVSLSSSRRRGSRSP